MTSIIKANKQDAVLLAKIARQSFIESHGSSATEADINFYVNKNYTPDIFEALLLNKENNYHILYYNGIAAGYSNIIFNFPYARSKTPNIAKLERIYLLQIFYNLKLGLQLFEFNINLAKEQHQKGVWLFVWKENQRAINFYRKNNFEITGSYDFKISETHSNPNHQMFLLF